MITLRSYRALLSVTEEASDVFDDPSGLGEDSFAHSQSGMHMPTMK